MPEVVVPIGDVAYNSTVTGSQERLPVSISMVVRKDCDYVLLDLLAALQNAGIVKSVKTGQSLY